MIFPQDSLNAADVDSGEICVLSSSSHFGRRQQTRIPHLGGRRLRTAERLPAAQCVCSVVEPSAVRAPSALNQDAATSNPASLHDPDPDVRDCNPSQLRLLLLEDSPADVELVTRALRQNGFSVLANVAQTPQEFLELIGSSSYDMILADYNLPQWRGMEALDLMRNQGLDIPLILVTGSLGDVTAVECIKQGATDYVLKDGLARLSISVRRALEERKLREEHKLAQEQLARNIEELARSNRDLEQFAYVASHDLQEPLRMVATYTQLLAEKYRGKLDEKADKYIAYSVDGALRMQTLIRDLLEFSRIGRHSTELKSVDCRAIIERVTRNLQAAIQESGAVICYDDLPVLVADASQLLQVFQNLIGNAIKFRGSEPPVIRLRAEKVAREWQFTVSDNGIGIPPENAETIFVIFKRLHSRAEYPGNGIGLSICKRIIEHHGGRIWVESGRGQGSTFKFTLPFRECTNVQGQPHEENR